ncbi:FAD binding domain-containing protein [Actinophytocola algeriensis]|uniref:CO/xanthine dehydrogenase FAD-binding subunit n=1 Tax=Actinophytocola algeriensis TaxID=1768010 RepID=A0A7W7VGN6_9PSEU|nr:FAD binding domain-containing protein [Actinophytocola algeriensis]MBB4909538.1 CO/xanthine dehydrogenase FAD-binding subunit [Actinophytocola algeriensis]MBE1475528.1 CO/xanthine dehydrogenase FAD-binding subunit [Actinophytocola algeriensis]
MLANIHLPASAAEAAGLLEGGGWLLGGGTLVMPRVNTGAVPVDTLISLRAAGLDGVRVADGLAEVGAAVTLARLGEHEELAFLRPVVRSIASPPVRNLATVGGNLFATQPHGDLAVALLALGARVDVLSTGGARTIDVGEAVAHNEVVTTVHFGLPKVWRYRKAMRRKHNSASIVTVAAALVVTGGVVEQATIALGGVASTPVRANAAEQALIGRPLDLAAAEAAAAAAHEGTAPFDDAYASAWYRARVLPVHVRRALLGED